MFTLPCNRHTQNMQQIILDYNSYGQDPILYSEGLSLRCELYFKPCFR